MLSGIFINNIYFGFCDVLCIRSTYSYTLGMNLQHYLRGSLLTHTEKIGEYLNYKIHRREIVVEQNDFVQGRSFQLRFGSLHDNIAIRVF